MESRAIRRLSTVVVLMTVVIACSTTESSVPATSASTSVVTTAPPDRSTPPGGPTSTTSTTSTTPTTPVPVTTTIPTTSTTPAPTTTALAPTTTPAGTVAPTTVPFEAPSIAVHRLPTDQLVVALTFDAGSDLGNTGRVLDVLAERGVQASFGITGAFADVHPDHVRRMAREGHVVMNHTYSHVSFTDTSSSDVLLGTLERQEDLLRADAVLAPLIGASTVPFWRPPFGDHDSGVLADVGAIGYGYTVMWTVDSLGWQGSSAKQITDRVIDLIQPGAIVLMHVGSQSADAEALPAVIDGLRSAGYSFTTIASALDR